MSMNTMISKDGILLLKEKLKEYFEAGKP